MLPIHFPPWQTVYWWFRRLARRLMFRTIHDVALMIDRAVANRDTEPTAAIIDSQTIKAPAPGAERGYDGGTQASHRRRYGRRLLLVHLTPANISHSAEHKLFSTRFTASGPGSNSFSRTAPTIDAN